MRAASLLTLVRAELARTRGPLVTAGFGIAVGVAALVFFLSLGFGARKVLLGDVFPIDQIELEPKKTSVGLISLLGGAQEPEGIEDSAAADLAALPGVAEVYPKLRFRFPSMARGGKEVLGSEIGTHEMVGDGIDPKLLAADPAGKSFADPLATPGKPCNSDSECESGEYCELPSDAQKGQCSKPVPALVSRYLVELFDHAVAPAHNLPPVAESLIGRAQGVVFEMTLGNSLLGRSRQGKERKAKIVVVGISPKAIDLGVTLPIDVVRRWNAEYGGPAAAKRYSSIVVRTKSSSDTGHVIDAAQSMGLVPHDTRARDVSVLISGVLALLVLVASVILAVAALNIAHTFRMLVAERQREIGLYRALGASAADMRTWLLTLALSIGSGAGLLGAFVARGGAWIADWRAAKDLPDFPFKPESFFVFPWWMWLIAVGFAALFSLLGAVGPARRASRTDPAQALARDE